MTRALAVIDMPEGGPTDLLASPWKVTVHIERGGIVAVFVREEGDSRAFVIQRNRRIVWGVQRRDGTESREGEASTLAEGHRLATDWLDTATVMSRMMFN